MLPIHQNVGPTDRVIRVMGAAIVATGLLGSSLSTPALLVWMMVPLVLLATAAIGFCPLYALLGLNTSRPQRH